MVEVNLNNNKESEMFVLIMIVGLLESFTNKVIDEDDIRYALFTPYSVHILKERGFKKEIIELVEECCEIEDVSQIMPHYLNEMVLELKNRAFKLLRNTGKYSDVHEVEKWLK